MQQAYPPVYRHRSFEFGEARAADLGVAGGKGISAFLVPGGLPKKTARALLDVEDRNYVPIIRDPARTTSESEAVFYFPGCGSERLFSQVGLATQAMLYEIGAQCVLPPGYLCCGYPQTAGGHAAKGEEITQDVSTLENPAILEQLKQST